MSRTIAYIWIKIRLFDLEDEKKSNSKPFSNKILSEKEKHISMIQRPICNMCNVHRIPHFIKIIDRQIYF